MALHGVARALVRASLLRPQALDNGAFTSARTNAQHSHDERTDVTTNTTLSVPRRTSKFLHRRAANRLVGCGSYASSDTVWQAELISRQIESSESQRQRTIAGDIRSTAGGHSSPQVEK